MMCVTNYSPEFRFLEHFSVVFLLVFVYVWSKFCNSLKSGEKTAKKGQETAKKQPGNSHNLYSNYDEELFLM